MFSGRHKLTRDLRKDVKFVVLYDCGCFFIGRSYAVRTHRMFQQCIESLVQKVQSGVVINFEKIGPDPAPIADGK